MDCLGGVQGRLEVLGRGALFRENRVISGRDSELARQPTADPPLKDWMLAVAENRDRDAFSRLFDHFAPRLKAFGIRSGADPETAEELAQEAMISVWRKADSFDPGKAAVSTWIFAIARNKRIDKLRRENRPEIEEEDYADQMSAPAAADATLEAAQNQVMLRKSIAALPKEQATIVEMAFYEDKSHSAIAEELSLPLGTVKSRIRLALNRLREEMKEFEE